MDALIAVGRAAQDTADPSRRSTPVVLSRRSDRLVVRVGGVVVKAHATGTDPDALAARVRVAAAGSVWVPPLSGPTVVGGRLVTVWPAGKPVGAVDPDDPERAPWREGATLLARLHVADPPAGAVPPSAAPEGVRRAVARIDTVPGAAAAAVRRAFRALPTARDGTSLVHGDWHLGQLVVPVERAGWRLIDVDDAGIGDPAWDLARPAALFAVGLLAPVTWACFVDAYRGAGGPAVPAGGDPWPPLDVPARALVVRLAAQAVLRAGGDELDESDEPLVDACVRICS